MGFVNGLLMTVLMLTTLFLIVLVLIQRGKGGGLAGAFGGMGGQSAFGTKAGDLFTKITIGVASFWIILCIAMVMRFGSGSSVINENLGGAAGNKPAATAPASTEKQPAGGKSEAPSSPVKTPEKQ
jgi:preprotein translocase subunit SecG